MIDNNDKSSLHNRWNMRILGIYFTNGLKRIFGKNSGRVIAIIYLAFCLIFWECRYSIWQPYGYFQNLQKFMTSVLVLILIPSVTFALTFFNRYAVWLNQCQQQFAQNRICKFRRRSTVAFVKIS